VFCMIHAWCVDLLRAWLVAFVLGGDAAVDTLVKHAARTVRGKKLLILLEHFLVVVGQGGYFVNFLGGVREKTCGLSISIGSPGCHWVVNVPGPN
jgi:hypothetical protein